MLDVFPKANKRLNATPSERHQVQQFERKKVFERNSLRKDDFLSSTRHNSLWMTELGSTLMLHVDDMYRFYAKYIIAS